MKSLRSSSTRPKSLPRPLAMAVLVVVLSGPLSCATTGPPPPPSQPAAREWLSPPLRLFYDTLTDYGDWVLIEPYGYVFRPAINSGTWRPYEDGFWAPTDSYGWVWISAEPFGWATYHYGTWFEDRFQGWVWMPGLDWGPAWVAWEQSNDYVGWAPATWNGGQLVPTGPYVYAPIRALGSTQLSGSIVTKDQLGSAAETLRPASNVVQRDGVAVPLGPSINRIEQLLGMPLPRAKVEDVLPSGAAGRTATRGAGGPTAAPLLDTMRRAGEDAARQARALTERPARAPVRLPLIRPGLKREPGARAPLPLPRATPVPRDSAAGDSAR